MEHYGKSSLCPHNILHSFGGADAVVKAIIFPFNATAFLKTVILYVSAGVKALFL